jgi:hypothetical protein
MNHFLKAAYDAGAQQAMVDMGLVKQAEGDAAKALGYIPIVNNLAPIAAAAQAPDGRGWSRAGHSLASGTVGALGGSLVGGGLGLAAGGGPWGRLIRSAGGVLGGGLGISKGIDMSREGDSLLQKMTR